MNAAILYGSVRHHRQGHRAMKWAEKLCREQDWHPHVLDARELNLPMLDVMYKEMPEPEPVFARLHDILEQADGFLLVTGEYNHAIPPGLKNLLDHFQQEYFFKPSAIISYSAGGFGGVRAAQALKLICNELGMPTISASVPVPKVAESLDEDGNVLNERLNRSADKLIREFGWYMAALKHQREVHGRPF